MAQMVIHSKEDPADSWIEVDGQRLEGIRVVIATEDFSLGEVAVTFHAESGSDVGVAWEDW